MTVELRSYQREAVTAVEDATRRGVQKPFVVLPTGTGKTIVAAELIAKRGGRALVIAHREELLTQAASKIKLRQPDLDIGFLWADHDDVGSQIVIASVQTLSRKSRLARLDGDFETVWIDEAHHLGQDTSSYMNVLERVSAAPLILGVSATPERTGTGVADYWDEIVYRRSILDMIRSGYLSDLRGIRIETNADLTKVSKTAGDYSAKSLSRELARAHVPEAALLAYKDNADDRSAILFAATVDMAHETAALFRRGGVSAEALDGGTDKTLRRNILKRLRSGKTRVVCNVGVLSEGYDEPSIGCIIQAAPTLSRLRYVQQVGRGTRTHPGKSDCIVIDLVGNSGRHDLVTLDTIAGKRMKHGETLAEASVRPDDHPAHDIIVDDVGQLGEISVVSADLLGRDKFHWMAVDDKQIIALGQGVLEITPYDDESYVVRRVEWGRHKIVDRLADIGYAQGLVEDMVREAGAEGLVHKNARWRTASPTDKQLSLIARRFSDIPRELTKGQASDMIAVALAYGNNTESWEMGRKMIASQILQPEGPEQRRRIAVS